MLYPAKFISHRFNGFFYIKIGLGSAHNDKILCPGLFLSTKANVLAESKCQEHGEVKKFQPWEPHVLGLGWFWPHRNFSLTMMCHHAKLEQLHSTVSLHWVEYSTEIFFTVLGDLFPKARVPKQYPPACQVLWKSIQNCWDILHTDKISQTTLTIKILSEKWEMINKPVLAVQ